MSQNQSKNLSAHRNKEEILNALIHGIAAILSVIGLWILVPPALDQNNMLKAMSLLIYGLSLVILYLASVVYHLFKQTSAKKVLRTMDHSAIYLLIAGSYTPFMLITLQGSWGNWILSIIWIMAILGIILKIIFVERFQRLSIAIYIIMGWLVVVAAKPIVQALPAQGIGWILAGGLFYTGGIIFYSRKSLHYSHAIWHMFVVCGSACHFYAVYRYILPENL